MTPTTRRLAAITAHARRVTAADRERLAASLPGAVPVGSVTLVTCHRVEAYLHADDAQLESFAALLPDGAGILDGNDAVRHVISVAAGLDSVVVGEDEILHQLRASLETTRAGGQLDTSVDRLLALALRAGRRARSWQQGRRRSLGDVAIDLISRRRGSVSGRPVLVVGAGKMGSLAAHAAANAGAAVTVANRTPEPAKLLAEATHGRSVELDPGPGSVAAAGVIVALGAPWTIDDRTAAALVDSGALVVDLSFPSAISPALAAALGDRLVTSDDVALEEVEAAASPRLLARLEHLVDASVAEFVEWHGRSDARALADALATRADAERRRELDALWRRLPSLGPDDREAIEEMTRHLASRLLREPLQRLGRDPNGPDGSVIRDLFAL